MMLVVTFLILPLLVFTIILFINSVNVGGVVISSVGSLAIALGEACIGMTGLKIEAF